jgi:hypothetical protein
MNDRRKSARLSLKATSCTGSSLNKPTLLECSPTSSSKLNLAQFSSSSSSSSPQASTSSPSKQNKSNSKLSQFSPKQQIKKSVKRKPKTLDERFTTLFSAETKEKKSTIRNKKSKTSNRKTKSSALDSNNKTNQLKSHNSRKKSKRSPVKKTNPPNTIMRILRPPSVDSPLSPTNDSQSAVVSSPLLTSASSPASTALSSLSSRISNAANNLQSIAAHNPTQNAANTSFFSNVETILRNNNVPLNFDNTLVPAINPLSDINIHDLKFQLKKATIKFEKACRQLIMLDQHINDLQNSYSNSLENDRKTFKIVYRMQLATLEGTHNAYIEYIERQVEKIKKLKRLLFNENATQHLNNSFNNTITTIGPLPAVSNISANANISSSSGLDAL